MQISNHNLLTSLSFKFEIKKFPTITYFCQSCSIPGIQIGESLHSSPFVDFTVPGETLTFDTLSISFLVDEDMKNYEEIYNWLVAMGFPKSYSQATIDRGDPEQVFSDATLTVLNNNKNPKIEFTFMDCFPTSLGNISFDSSMTDADAILCDVVFSYKLFEMKRL